MYNYDDGVGAAMAASHNREMAEKAQTDTAAVAAIVLAALMGNPASEEQLRVLRRIAGQH